MKDLMRPSSALPEIGLDFLLARCAESDGCLVWKRRLSSGPITNIEGRTFKVRHLVWHVVHGWAPRDWQIPEPTVCGNPRCLHPDHLTLVKRNSHAKGKRITLTHRANIAAAKRATAGKITPEQVEEIRASTDLLKDLSARYGISMSQLHRIKTHQSWADHSNPFNQLINASSRLSHS